MDRQSVISNAESDGGRSSGSWRPGLDPEDELALEQAREDGAAIVEEIPTDDDSLGWFSVICLLLNRMIGSGIFNSGFLVFKTTHSIGISLIFWLYGCLTAISGVILYIELGLVIPRYLRNGVRISTPRSGGELPIFNYMLKKPRFLATCLFGISFLVFGNTATNSVSFAVATLETSGTADNPGKIAVIAIAANTFCCLIHSMSRKWGIRLNNVLGTLKLSMLFIMIIFGLVWMDKSVANANLDRASAFALDSSPKRVYRYAEAAILAMFPFGGFHQANYVLAEIRNPRKNYAITTGLGVFFICCVFMFVNVLYAAVIPKSILFETDIDKQGLKVSLQYFQLTVGRLTQNEAQTRAIWGSFRALSAIGNVIVFTYTAARVKQEIAKEGILPGSIYLASSYKFGFRHGFQRLQDGSAGKFPHTEKAPVAALALHWIVTFILILAAVFATTSGGVNGSYNYVPGWALLLTGYTYCLDVVYFSCIGVGMLYLRLWPGSKWRYKSPIPHLVGVACAVLFTATNVFPLICIWIPDPEHGYLALAEDVIVWFASQTFVISVIGASFIYWLGFRLFLEQQKKRKGVVLDIVRQPLFKADRNGRDLIQAYEIIKLEWTAYDSESTENGRSGVTNTELGVLDGNESQPRDWRTSVVTQTTA